MPSKSRSKRGDRELTRTALLRAYGITDKTLRRLTEVLRLVDLKVVSGRGRIRYVIDAETDAVLQLARNCPDSFSPLRPPFLRYLMLGFLTVPDQESIDGLHDRGIRVRTVGKSVVAEAREQFCQNLPPVIRKVITAQDDPSTEAQERAYDTLLRILGLRSIYHHPQYLDDFYFEDENLLHFFNQVVWSHSTDDRVRAGVMAYAAGYRVVTPEGVAWYRLLLHDNSFMRPSDMARYLGGLPATIKAAYRESLTTTTEDLIIRSQLAHNTVRELDYFSRLFKSQTRNLLMSKADGARSEAMKMMQTALKIDDQIGKLKPEGVGKEMPSHMEAITPAEYSFEDQFDIPPELRDASGEEEEVG